MADGTNQLPPSIQGDGKKFISLLKNYLQDIQDQITDQLNNVKEIENVISDDKDTIEEQVHSLTVEEKTVNGNISLLVKWNADDIKQYRGAVLDVKVGDVKATLAGFDGVEFTKQYEAVGSKQYLIENVQAGRSYYIRVRAKDKVNALSRASKAPSIVHYIEPNKHAPRPPYEATVVFDKRGAYWSWKQYDQNEYLWTELRLDDKVGELHNRLDITTDLHSTAKPYARTGTGYLYNKGVGNVYSAPCKVPYSKAVPKPPKNVVIKHVADGLFITFDKIPDDCIGAIIYINGEPHPRDTNEYLFICSTGTYIIHVVYTDIFGEGDKSKTEKVMVEEIIDPELYDKESLSYKRIADARKELNDLQKKIDGDLTSFRDKFIKQVTDLTASTKSQITQLGNAIDLKVQAINKDVASRFTITDNAINTKVNDVKNYVKTEITQLGGDINLQVTQLNQKVDATGKKIDGLDGKELISRINVSPEAVSIDGKYVHITGKTVIDGNVIVAKHIGDKAIVATKIAEGAITTDKIAANAITATKIAGNSITGDKLAVNTIESKHIATNSLDGDRIKSDSITADKLKANSITGDKLVADSITGDKIKAGSIGVDKLKAGVINLGDMNSTLQGGTVRIDGTGMYVGQGNGSYTKFDESGLVWYDSKGQAFGSVRRMIKGVANHGDRINIHWDTVPYVMVTPTVIPLLGDPGNAPHNGNIVCRAINISKTGFNIEAYTELTAGNAMRFTRQHNWKMEYHMSNINVWSPIDTTVIFTCKDGLDIYVNGQRAREGGLGNKHPVEYDKYANEPMPPYYSEYKFLRSGHHTSYSDNGHDYSWNIWECRYDYAKAPFVDTPISLHKGYNCIEGVAVRDAIIQIGWYESVGWIKTPPDFLKFYKPFDAPVNFIAMDFPFENHYNIKKQGFRTQTFTGRGKYKFKPKGNRFKVYLIGASSFPWNNRPMTAETKISGGGISYRSHDRLGQVNGIDGNAKYKQELHGHHPSWKGNEQGPIKFWCRSFGLGQPEGYGEDFTSDPIRSLGYLEGTPNDSIMASFFVAKQELPQGEKPTFRIQGQGLDHRGKPKKWGGGEFGLGLKLFGCPVPTWAHTSYYGGSRGTYARWSTLTFELGMGLSNPASYEVKVPNNNTEYTIEVGACPDAWVGKVIPIGGSETQNSSLTILNTKSFDGGCIIVEEE